MSTRERTKKLFKSSRFTLAVLLLPFFGILAGCQFFTDSFDSAVSLDQAGKSAEAIKAYQSYLKGHETSPQASRVYYRVAKNYEAQADYKNALLWHEQVLKLYPKSDEAVHSLLDVAAIYRDKLKNTDKAIEYDKKAFERTMDNTQLRDAVQTLIDGQIKIAAAAFDQKEYKIAEAAAATIFQIYPTALLLPETRAKVQLLLDRAHRAESMAETGVDSIKLVNEGPVPPDAKAYFEDKKTDDKVIPSPDGSVLVSRKKSSNGSFYLYLAKAPKKGEKVDFKKLSKTKGAHQPAWSPDGKEIVYCRTVKKERSLEKITVKTKAIETLFSTQSSNLGIYPVFHPAGNKVACVYEGMVCLINSGNKTPYVYEGSASLNSQTVTYFKQLLKTKLKLGYDTQLEWSTDGTMIRCRQTDKKGKITDELLALDVTTPNNP
jgi:tetratricopeptide (TPR) repeat protein